MCTSRRIPAVALMLAPKKAGDEDGICIDGGSQEEWVFSSALSASRRDSHQQCTARTGTYHTAIL